jgi:hypothetical protein
MHFHNKLIFYKSVDIEDDPKPTHQQGLGCPRDCTQRATQQERGVLDQTNLETDETDVEPILDQKSSRTTPGKTRRGGACGGSPRTSKIA